MHASLSAAIALFALTVSAAAAEPVLTALPAPLETRNSPVNWTAT